MVEEIERVKRLNKELSDKATEPERFRVALLEMADALSGLEVVIKEKQSLINKDADMMKDIDIKITNEPDNLEKIYGYLRYHEWFFEWNNIEEAFEDIIKLYMTQMWWDYDGFNIYKGNPNWELGVDKPINWIEMLSEEQQSELKKAEEYNFNMNEKEQSPELCPEESKIQYCMLRINNGCVTIICDDLEQECKHRIEQSQPPCPEGKSKPLEGEDK